VPVRRAVAMSSKRLWWKNCWRLPRMKFAMMRWMLLAFAVCCADFAMGGSWIIDWASAIGEAGWR
jgi:hypothetical protein